MLIFIVIISILYLALMCTNVLIDMLRTESKFWIVIHIFASLITLGSLLTFALAYVSQYKL